MLKKAILITFILLILAGLVSTCCQAKDLTVQNGSIALDEISENNLYIEKIFAMYSMEFKKKHDRADYENLIYENDKCVMCGKEK